MDNIIQWNIQSYRSNFQNLKLLLAEHSPACVCLQETLTGPNLHPPSSHVAYTSLPTRQDNHERGSAILVRNTVFHKHLPLRTPLQATAVRIYLDKVYTVCSLYLPHTDVSRADVAALLDQLPRPFLLLGDMNARGPLWDPGYTSASNSRGALFEELLADRDISLLNNDSFTHYHIQTNTYSVIDLSLCSSDALLNFRYSVDPSLHGSDHYPIHLKLLNTSQARFSKPERFCFKRANWGLYRTLTDVSAFPAAEDGIDDFVSRLAGFLLSAASLSIPKSRPTCKHTPVPWWSEDLSAAKRDCLRAERRLKNGYSLERKIAYNRTKAKVRYLCKKAQQDCWISFISSINQRSSLHSMWKKIQKIAGRFAPQPVPALNIHGRIVTDVGEVARELCSAFAAVSHSSQYGDAFVRFKRTREAIALNFQTSQYYAYNAPFTMLELDAALKATQEGSPGHDTISYSMVKRAHPTFRALLLDAYNRIYETCEYPDSWALSLIVPILKPGRDPLLPSNYRPIALTSCLGKIMERMINSRLTWFLEHNNLLCEAQSGFRTNRSTTDNLVKLDFAIRQSLSRRHHFIAVFFDINKAYDTAWRYGILQTLHSFGLRGNLPAFLRGFLSNRRVRVRLADCHSPECGVEEGIPQGSVLSCTCFMIAMNTISANLPANVDCTLYVDDYAIFASGPDPRTLQRRLQVAINHLQTWSERTGFKFSSEKTVSLHVCRKRNCPRLSPDLRLYGQPIPQRDTVRYLGVTFDSSYSWRPHITALKVTCNKILDLFKHVSHRAWGADRTSLLRLYIMLLKPKLEYGVEIIQCAAPTYVKVLERIQNQALRIASGAFRSSPICSLHAECGIKPFRYFVDTKSLNFYLRILVNPTHPLRYFTNDMPVPPNSFLLRIRDLLPQYRLGDLSLLPETFHTESPWTLQTLSKCTTLYSSPKSQFSSMELKAMFNTHLLTHTDDLVIYTDGSKSDNGVAYATVSDDTAFAAALPNRATIFTAELMAIFRALDSCSLSRYSSVVIVTDSRSSIEALEAVYSRHPIVQKIQGLLLESSKSFTFCWCPSHVGVSGNEKADCLARNTAEDGVPTRVALPRTDVKVFLKSRSRELWRDEWISQPVTNKLRALKTTISPFPNSCFSNRHWERTLCRLRIGHTNLTHGFLMDQSHQPYCQDCLVPLTIYHLLVECPTYLEDRRVFGTNPTIKTILTTHANSNGPLFQFLTLINVLYKI